MRFETVNPDSVINFICILNVLKFSIHNYLEYGFKK